MDPIVSQMRDLGKRDQRPLVEVDDPENGARGHRAEEEVIETYNAILAVFEMDPHPREEWLPAEDSSRKMIRRIFAFLPGGFDLKNAVAAKTANELKNIWPGQSIELLKSLHILTREGALNQDSKRKLKQVQHLVQFLTPQLEGLKTVADLGAGKSYLGFMLYDLWLREHPESHLFAIESREALIKTCEGIARSSGFDRITFVAGSILESLSNEALPESIDAVTALHACDTATDEAIAFALKKNAKFIALVPCCQAEVARLLEDVDTKQAVAQSLWRHGIHRREFGSHLTNVIRALFLESRGYKVRVTELVGWEHSMKNELILAMKIQNGNAQAKTQLDHLLREFPVAMKLFDLLK